MKPSQSLEEGPSEARSYKLLVGPVQVTKANSELLSMLYYRTVYVGFFTNSSIDFLIFGLTVFYTLNMIFNSTG